MPPYTRALEFSGSLSNPTQDFCCPSPREERYHEAHSNHSGPQETHICSLRELPLQDGGLVSTVATGPLESCPCRSVGCHVSASWTNALTTGCTSQHSAHSFTLHLTDWHGPSCLLLQLGRELSGLIAARLHQGLLTSTRLPGTTLPPKLQKNPDLAFCFHTFLCLHVCVLTMVHM